MGRMVDRSLVRGLEGEQEAPGEDGGHTAERVTFSTKARKGEEHLRVCECGDFTEPVYGVDDL